MQMMSRSFRPLVSRASTAKALREAFALHTKGDLIPALHRYAHVLKREPRNPVALHYAALLGRHLNDHARAEGKQPRDDEVMRLMELSVEFAPTSGAAVHNFAKFRKDRGEAEQARMLYERAVALDPLQAESWNDLGNVYAELGNTMRAEASWLRALECPLTSPEARFNLSFLRLLRGDYAGGWRDYEARWACPTFRHNYARPDLTAAMWDGRPLAGTLYLHQEQGVGDAIMMARYVPLAQQRAGRVVLEVIRGAVTLFQAMFPGLEVVARSETSPAHDAQLPMLSLPAIFGTTLENIPESAPFAAKSPEGASIHVESRRIGLCWQGSTTHVNDRLRSMPFEACFPMLDVPGVSWQSLQYGYETGPPLDVLPLGDFLETARQIARCELVISVDTSIAHLAASMGVPTWILLPASAEWRWLERREDSPWYPTARLFKQPKAGDWRGLAERVARALTERFPHSMTV